MQQASPVPERADVVVIGGGINGISTFRELALQGVDVVLLERDDFCSMRPARLGADWSGDAKTEQPFDKNALDSN